MNTALLLLGLWGGCQATDAATTYVALHSGKFVEGNAAMRSSGHLYLVKASVNVGAFVFQQKVIQPKAGTWGRRILPLAFAGAGCAAGTWNLHQLSSK